MFFNRAVIGFNSMVFSILWRQENYKGYGNAKKNEQQIVKKLFEPPFEPQSDQYSNGRGVLAAK